MPGNAFASSLYKFDLSIYAVLISLLVMLTACGGGGGEDGNSDPFASINLSSVTYNGSTQSLSLAASEEEFYAVQLAVESTLILDIVASFWINQSLPVVNTEIDGSAGGKARTVSTGAEIVVTYLSFTESGLTVTGQTRQNQPSVTTQIGEVDGFLELNHLVVSSGAFGFTVDGRIVGSTDNEGTNQIVVDVVLVDNNTGQAVSLENYILTSERVNQNFALDQKYLSINGHIYESDLGHIYVETTRPMLDLAIDLSTGTLSSGIGGLITIYGDGESIQFSSLNDKWGAIIKDKNNDSIVESGRRISWFALNNSEPPLELFQGSKPVANAGGKIFTSVGNEVILHGLFSHDPDNQYLQYSWQLLVAPAGHSLSREQMEGVFYHFVPDVPGEYLFRLTVSDGVNIVERGSAVSVREFGTLLDKPVLTGTAALDVLDSSFGSEDTFSLDAFSIYGPEYDESGVIWDLDKPQASTDAASLVFSGGSFMNTFVADPDVGGSYRINGLRFAVGAAGYDFYLDQSIDRTFYDFENTDFNNDGIEDYVAIDLSSSGDFSVQVWIGSEDGDYTSGISTMSGRQNLTIGDLNDDGLKDVVSNDSGHIYISYQSVAGDLGAPVLLGYATPCVSGTIFDIAISDSNNDGLNDLWIAKGCSSEVEVWQQNQSGTLESSIVVDVGENMHDARFAKFNADELLDLAYSTRPSGSNGVANIAMNNNMSFSVLGSFENQAIQSAPYICVGDLDGSGIDEVIQHDGGRVAILKKNNSDIFEQIDDAYLSAHIAFRPKCVVGDFEGDGDNDFVLAGLYDMFTFVNEEGNFHPALFGASGLTTRAVGIMDYNKDGHNDIVLFGHELFRQYTNAVRSFSTE